jgi:hypothetical protein
MELWGGQQPRDLRCGPSAALRVCALRYHDLTGGQGTVEVWEQPSHLDNDTDRSMKITVLVCK